MCKWRVTSCTEQSEMWRLRARLVHPADIPSYFSKPAQSRAAECTFHTLEVWGKREFMDRSGNEWILVHIDPWARWPHCCHRGALWILCDFLSSPHCNAGLSVSVCKCDWPGCWHVREPSHVSQELLQKWGKMAILTLFSFLWKRELWLSGGSKKSSVNKSW